VASKLSLFLAELKRRKVYRVAAVYGAIGVAISVAVPDLFNAFDLSSSAARLVILLIAIGFPIALVLAWAYEVRPEEPGSGERPSGDSTSISEIPGPAVVPAADQRKSIAVLPFTDMSPHHDQEYFGDGVAEEVLNVLTRIPDLRVAARTSSFSYREKGSSITEIGRELGVATVLEGSVRKAGDRLRITAQLTETPAVSISGPRRMSGGMRTSSPFRTRSHGPSRGRCGSPCWRTRTNRWCGPGPRAPRPTIST
jgi:adenylate cyclase